MAEQRQLDPEMTIQEISEQYPEVVETLIIEYGFHCIGCFVSEFETLEEGAAVHGIYDSDFQEMMDHLNQLINSPREPD